MNSKAMSVSKAKAAVGALGVAALIVAWASVCRQDGACAFPGTRAQVIEVGVVAAPSGEKTAHAAAECEAAFASLAE